VKKGAARRPFLLAAGIKRDVKKRVRNLQTMKSAHQSAEKSLKHPASANQQINLLHSNLYPALMPAILWLVAQYQSDCKLPHFQ
jgi:hypothetical protein